MVIAERWARSSVFSCAAAASVNSSATAAMVDVLRCIGSLLVARGERGTGRGLRDLLAAAARRRHSCTSAITKVLDCGVSGGLHAYTHCYPYYNRRSLPRIQCFGAGG